MKLKTTYVLIAESATESSQNQVAPADERKRVRAPLHFFLVDLLGLRDGVFPGVDLLSRRRWSGFPVDFAIGLGPGLSAIDALLRRFNVILAMSIAHSGIP